MQRRKAIVAGQFYPGQHDSCVEEINQYLDEIGPNDALPETIAAGIVPHAGWAFSGKLAAMVFAAVKQVHEKVNTFVIFGAAHGYYGQTPALFEAGNWVTPLGEALIDEELANQVLGTQKATSDTHAHGTEHSIEVQVPFIQHLFAGAKILPILVPPTKEAIALGEAIGDIISKAGKKIMCIGSTDLTHYGPRYGFTPKGTDENALQWASEVNDKKFIDAALKLDAESLITTAAEDYNACGPGAAAAAIAAAKKLGKTEGLLLAHTNSNEVMSREMGTSGADSVGYAAIVF
jgi:AmmeMemoRadiSam system protein B